MSDLRMLAMPFPSRVVHTNPSGGGSYVSHHLYTQRLLLHLGSYDFTVREVIRGHVPEIKPNPSGNSQRAKDGRPALENAVVGVLCHLAVRIDGELSIIDEAGDCEDPHNWPHDGARLKDAMSDALKRCCARIGLGTHLYAKSPDEFVLFDKLTEREQSDTHPSGDEPGGDGSGGGGPSDEGGHTVASAANDPEDPVRPFL